MVTRTWGPVSAVLILLFATGLSPAAGQVLSGVVVSDQDGGPLRGAVVELLDGGDAVVATRLTGPDGAFSYQNVTAGRYRFRVGLLGYRTVTTDPFDLAAGQTLHRRVAIPLEAIRLGGLRVTRDRRCNQDFGGTDLVRLWTEARKGLTAVVLTEESSPLSFRVQIHDRDLDPEWRTVMSERTRTSRSWGHDSFRSAPADTLLQRGFIRRAAGDSVVYDAPDAQLLLSEPFLEQYCFGIREGRGGRVGLTFQPAARLRGTAQIEGVLWLDAETAGLEQLEFEYTRSPVVRNFDAGGEVNYEQLSDGAWIVRDWHLRMPRPALVNGLPTSNLGAIHETRGQVVEVLGLDEPVRWQPAGDSSGVAGRDEARGSSQGGGSAPPPEEGRALTTWVRNIRQPRRQMLYMRNDSDTAVRVTSVTLDRCINLRELCGRHDVNVVLEPGERGRLLVVHPADTGGWTFFYWTYQVTSL